jgi:hypothetical protein
MGRWWWPSRGVPRLVRVIVEQLLGAGVQSNVAGLVRSCRPWAETRQKSPGARWDIIGLSLSQIAVRVLLAEVGEQSYRLATRRRLVC